MWDDDDDNKIREAADHYHPVYDDKAWDNMEKMLDKHLPQKKDRKKFFFLLPFLLLSGGLIFFIVSHNHEKHRAEIARTSVSKDMLQRSGNAKSSTVNSSDVPINIPSLAKPDRNQTPEKNKAGLQTIQGNTESTDQVSVSLTHNSTNRNKKNSHKENLPFKSMILLQQGSIAEKNNGNEMIKSEFASSAGKENESLNQSNNISEKNANRTESMKADNQTKVVSKTGIKKQDTLAKTENEHPKTIKEKIKRKNGFQNNFGLTFSAGPDISGVDINNAGKLTITYGAGLSYAISQKFTIRTGFYLSKKIYSVWPDDYHLPAGGSGNYDYLQNIDANCNVYEIPVNVNYNFSKTKNHNWFISTGLSSYLMKREKYNYYYKDPTGNAYTKDWTINNKNQHFFAILNLSGGYQYFFNKQFSIMAEPYVSLPLSGIGAGKVKLNSSGILFTLTVKPFLKNRQ